MAKSTLILDFVNTPSLDGSVVVTIHNGSTTFQAALTAKAQRLAAEQYDLVLPPPTSVQPLFAFVTAWNIDHKNTGGFDNMKAVTFDDAGTTKIKIELDNEQWTFSSVAGTSVTGGDITAAITNIVPPAAKSYAHALTSADCNNANYSITITGGMAPYTIKGTPAGDLTGQAASSTFQLQRGTPATVRVEDSLGALIQSKSIVPPKNIKTGYFDIDVVPENGANTANVSPNIVFENDLLPFTYSLDGVTYSQTSSFPALAFDDTFTMYIKDTFGCVITKTFVTLSDYGTATSQQYLRHFEISNAGTLLFAEHVTLSETVKKNPNNSLSGHEFSRIPYTYVHEFSGNKNIVQQFKSSYGYHKITLMEDGVATYIQPILQYENLNQLEKVDGKLFRTVTGKMGLYFDNGNTYIPNTTTTNGTSDYDASSHPSWGKIGQVLVIDGVGSKTIVRVTMDSQRGLYLEFADQYTSLTDVDVKVQANYNRQPYNLYEFALPMLSITSKARVFIEVGFNDLVERTFKSELIKKIVDDEDRLLVEWNDPENKSGIVHQTGIKHFAQIYAKFIHRSVSRSEVDTMDDNTHSLDQEVYTVADIELAVLGFGMEKKLALAAAMENFTVNGLIYKKESWSSEPQEDSNVYEIKGLLRLGGNESVVEAGDIVLDPPSTPLTNKPGVPATIPNILNLGSDVLVLNGDGGFILVDNG